MNLIPNFFWKKKSSSFEKISYAQCGEDLIVDFLFSWLGISEINYLDIGAHHPSHFSNTFFFYKKGMNGVLVEADISLCKELKETRPLDLVLNLAVSPCGEGEIPLYIMSSTTLNTLNHHKAQEIENAGRHKIESIAKVQQVKVMSIVNQYFSDRQLSLVSLDIEGLDFDVLKTWDFSKSRPAVFCLETLTYTENNTEEKISEIIDFMISNNYLIYADTYINTIFVCRHIWGKRSF